VVDAVLGYFHRLEKAVVHVPLGSALKTARDELEVLQARNIRRGFRCAGNSRKEKAWTAHPQALGELSEGACYCHNAISHLKTARRVLPIIAPHDLSRNRSQKFSNVDALEWYFVGVRVYLVKKAVNGLYGGIRTLRRLSKSQSVE
jgi:hypothetical protein